MSDDAGRTAARRGAQCALALLVLMVAGGSGVLSPLPAEACSQAANSADFDGTVVLIDGPMVTYRVDRVRREDPGQGYLDLTAPIPEPGGRVVVRYHGRVPQLALDESYRVIGWTDSSERINSQIAYDFDGDCGSGAGTTALDGSYLKMPADVSGRLWPYPVLGLLLAGGVLLAAHTFVARRADRALAESMHEL